jgi:hypothetical protein
MTPLRIRVLAPARAAAGGVYAEAGEVLDVHADVAAFLLETGAAEDAGDSEVGPNVIPEPVGYRAMGRDDLVREAHRRGIEGIGMMNPEELVVALEASDASLAGRGTP